VEAGPARPGRRPGRHPERQVRREGDQDAARTARTPAPFRFQDRGDVAVIGRLSGVTNIGWLGPLGQAGGFFAWLLWLGIHITYLIGFANRLVVLTRWAWTFFTHGRGSRLITGQPLLPDIEEPEPPA
jgi:NADH dehydrogenase